MFGQLRIPMVSKYNYWEYGIEFTIGIANVSRIIKQFIVEIIKPRNDILTELSGSCNMEFYIAQNLFDDYHPSLTFSNDDILLLGKIGMRFDLDLWNLEGHESS